LISNTRLPPHQVAKNLIEIYWHIKRPIAITYNQLRDISGRDKLHESVINNISQELYEQDFAFIDDRDDDGRVVYLIARKKWLSRKSTPIDASALKDYYFERVGSEVNEEEDND